MTGSCYILAIVQIWRDWTVEGDDAAHCKYICIGWDPQSLVVPHAAVEAQAQLPVRVGVWLLAVSHAALGVIVSIAVIGSVNIAINRVLSWTPRHAYPGASLIISVREKGTSSSALPGEVVSKLVIRRIIA